MGFILKTPREKLKKLEAELTRLNLEIQEVFQRKNKLQAGSKGFARLERAQRELELLVQERYVEKSRLLGKIK